MLLSFRSAQLGVKAISCSDLPIAADAVLFFAVSGQSFEVVVRRQAKCFQLDNGCKQSRFSQENVCLARDCQYVTCSACIKSSAERLPQVWKSHNISPAGWLTGRLSRNEQA